jgi:hypothetical protein
MMMNDSSSAPQLSTIHYWPPTTASVPIAALRNTSSAHMLRDLDSARLDDDSVGGETSPEMSALNLNGREKNTNYCHSI